MFRSGAIFKNTNVKLDKKLCLGEFDPPLWNIHFVMHSAAVDRYQAARMPKL
jgi:hypothetical protein